MTDLPLNALRVFAAVQQNAGIRPAARQLGVSPSAVSRHLRELERWIGLPLTTGRGADGGLALTMEGERLAVAVASGLATIEAGVLGVREVRRPSTVWISTVPSFAARWLMPRLAAFKQQQPRIELSVMVDQGRGAPPPREAELRISMGAKGVAGLSYRTLMHDELVPVASPKYLEATGLPASPHALAGMTLIHDRDPFTSWERWFSGHTPASPPPVSGPRFTSADLVLRAAAAGFGVALTRKRLAADDLASGVLVRLLEPLTVPLENAYLMARADGASDSHALRTVEAWLEEEASTQA